MYMYTTQLCVFHISSCLEGNAAVSKDSHKYSAKARYVGMRHKLTSTFHAVVILVKNVICRFWERIT